MDHDRAAHRGPRSNGRNAIIAFCTTLIMLAPGAWADGTFKPHPGGVWKIHPPTNFKGEFGGEDPIGLAFSKHIPTDCSIVWKNGQKFYCFSSQMSSQFVQEKPDDYLPQAAAFWAKQHPEQSDAQPKSASAPADAASSR